MASIGLRACLLADRWRALVSASGRPLVVSAEPFGALDPGLHVGDVALSDRVINEAGTHLSIIASAPQRAAVATGANVRRGAMASSSRVAATPEAKAALRAATGAVAVDMESAAILEAAAAHGCASMVVRGVSDDARGSLRKELLALMGADGRISGGSVFTLARPRVLAGALRLRRAKRQALGSVAGSLARLAA